jgi:hypothetical protein
MHTNEIDSIVDRVIQMESREIMPLLIQGLAGYTAELIQRFGGAPEFDKSDDLRSLIGDMAAYWGLDNNSDEDAERDFLEPFDRLIDEAVSSADPPDANAENITGAILALYRYATDLTDSHGDDALTDIDLALDTMRELAQHWGIAEEEIESLSVMVDARL